MTTTTTTTTTTTVVRTETCPASRAYWSEAPEGVRFILSNGCIINVREDEPGNLAGTFLTADGEWNGTLHMFPATFSHAEVADWLMAKYL